MYSSLLRVASVAVVLFGVVLGAGCGGAAGDAQGGEPPEGGQITVLAASSLTDAFEELAGTFREQNPGTEVRTSFAASSELLAQVQQGAPADVFASASEKNMDTAVEEDLVGEASVFARNRPVVIVPADNPAGIGGFEDLAEADAQLVLAEEGVPIADYATEVLANADAEYGDGFEEAVTAKIVSREANVRAAANRVALGEADATFVYASDVTEDIRDRVEVIEIPEEVNVVATYPIAAVRASESPELAQAWVDLVLGDEGQDVLEEHGFERADES
ncbi:molybdate ABC transporter substrate-binding protein [Rubrobacter marinus]|uniref:Molybdate ABC transporter substrate-binding protein n=1 Tax=Rubrobacter marinus TaxID=2653852 RepID=A0A6G8Q298_9ACTN|nr:molybdate ABC transporter substrate-binding protein [Rubrobacter marinus]